MEYINNLAWPGLADYKIDLRGEDYGKPGDIHPNPNEPPVVIPDESCVIHYHPEYSYKIFNALEEKYIENPKLKYILISSDGDCGLCYQDEHKVANDFKKAIYMFNVERLGYEDLHIATRCNKALCNINHKFSVRMYAYTYSTFDRLPPNVVRLYAVNNDTDEDDKIVSIPFGVPDWFEDIAWRHYVDCFKIDKLQGRTYVAFQMNTTERHKIMHHFKTDDNYLVRKETVSHKQYVEDLLTCGTCLSPRGNGLDCYRNLEALYLGVAPIISPSRVLKAYQGLPYILNGEGATTLSDCDYNNTRADFTYWRDRLNKDRINLL